jgi:hypothetical protein
VRYLLYMWRELIKGGFALFTIGLAKAGRQQ